MDIFPVFCTVDVSSELLATFLLQAHEPMREGTVDGFEMECVVLRSTHLASITERTPVPISGVFPDALASPFPGWTAQQVHDFLQLHAPGTKIDSRNFIIIDGRSAQDYTCEIADRSTKFSETKSMRALGPELKTMRATFRDSLLSLVNLGIANTDMEEMRDNAEADGGISMIGETEEGRKRDLEDATMSETVLRSGKVVRE